MATDWSKIGFLALSSPILLAPAAIEGEEHAGEEYAAPLREVFQSELVFPEEQGEIQFTLAPRFSSAPEGDAFSSRAAVEYGLTDNWDLELEWDFFVHRERAGETAEGFGNVEIAVKWARLEVAKHTHVAFGLEVGLPIADIDDNLTEGFLEFEPFVVLARDFPQIHDLHLFAQVSLGLVDRVRHPSDPDEEEPAAHELELNLGAVLPARHFVATLEVNWADNTWNHDGDERELYLTPGLVWQLPGDWEMGFGVPIGIGGDADDYRLIMMWTVEH